MLVGLYLITSITARCEVSDTPIPDSSRMTGVWHSRDDMVKRGSHRMIRVSFAARHEFIHDSEVFLAVLTDIIISFINYQSNPLLIFPKALLKTPFYLVSVSVKVFFHFTLSAPKKILLKLPFLAL